LQQFLQYRWRSKSSDINTDRTFDHFKSSVVIKFWDAFNRSFTEAEIAKGNNGRRSRAQSKTIATKGKAKRPVRTYASHSPLIFAFSDHDILQVRLVDLKPIESAFRHWRNQLNLSRGWSEMAMLVELLSITIKQNMEADDVYAGVDDEEPWWETRVEDDDDDDLISDSTEESAVDAESASAEPTPHTGTSLKSASNSTMDVDEDGEDNSDEGERKTSRRRPKRSFHDNPTKSPSQSPSNRARRSTRK
jgi:hypothetical protein